MASKSIDDMSYRHHQGSTADAESLRPSIVGFWREFRVRCDCFINLTSERWFREWCGGTWIRSEYVYTLAVAELRALAGILPTPYTSRNWPTRDAEGNDFFMCEWLPLLPLQHTDGTFSTSWLHVAYNAEHDHSMISIDVDNDTLLYRAQVFDAHSKHWKKILTNASLFLREHIEVYPYCLRLNTKLLRFEPSLPMILKPWPDYEHMKHLGLIKSYGEES